MINFHWCRGLKVGQAFPSVTRNGTKDRCHEADTMALKRTVSGLSKKLVMNPANDNVKC